MSKIPAGEPEDTCDASEVLDFNRDVLNGRTCFVYASVKGDSMQDVGIGPGSLLLINREAEAQDGCIAVIKLDGEWAVKRFQRRGTKLRLISENTNYEPIDVDPSQRLDIFGVVEFSVKCHKLGMPHPVFSVW